METLITVGLVVAALAGMSVYLGRGIQGYLYAMSEAQGPQFDPRQPFTGDFRLRDFTAKTTSTVISETPSVDQFGGRCPDIAAACLPSTPGGPQVGTILRMNADVKGTWDVQRSSRYEVE